MGCEEEGGEACLNMILLDVRWCDRIGMDAI